MRSHISSSYFLFAKGFDLGKALTLYFINNKIEPIFCKTNVFSVIKRLIYYALYNDIVLNHEGNTFGRNLFIYDLTFPANRPDDLQMFENVADCCDDRQIWTFDIKGKASHHSLTHIVSYLFFMISAIYNVLSYKKTFIGSKKILLINLAKCYNTISEIKKLPINIASSTVFYDLGMMSNLTQQYYNIRKIPTITMQHGVALRFRNPNNLDFAAPEFESMVSLHYLVWNKFTYKQAISYGISPKNLHICGIARCLGNKPIIKENNIGIFGVVLDGRNTVANNNKMLYIANDIAIHTGLKYIIRLHPEDKSLRYSEDLKKGFCIGFSQRTSILDYIDTVDFSLVCNSTAIMEFSYFCHLFYRVLPVEISLDKYLDTNLPSICSYDDYRKLDSNNLMKIYREEFSDINDIKEQYKKVFKEIGSK